MFRCFLDTLMGAFTKRFVCLFVAVAFILTSIISPAYAQSVFNLPQPGMVVPLSEGYAPAVVRGLTIHPENALEFNFLIDQGQNKFEDQQLRQEATKLIKYFLAGLTVPEKELWVNLSPYEKDRIVPDGFGQTEMGRDLLAQDYMLKQLTGSVMIPEEQLGKAFWAKVYAQAQEKFGTTDMTLDTFNKIWVVPQTAELYEKGNTVVIVKSHLKVMLDTDYVALSNNRMPTRGHVAPFANVSPSTLPTPQPLDAKATEGTNPLPADQNSISSELTTAVMREILIPAIEKEVNEGKTFASLRQIYNSVILAAWYKKNLQASLLGQVYADQGKVKGVDHADAEVNQKIYAQYVEAFKKGVYNLIKEEYDPVSQQTVPRKYFTGGNDLSHTTATLSKTEALDMAEQKDFAQQNLVDAKVNLQDFGPSAADEAVKANVDPAKALATITTDDVQKEYDIPPGSTVREIVVQDDLMAGVFLTTKDAQMLLFFDKRTGHSHPDMSRYDVVNGYDLTFELRGGGRMLAVKTLDKKFPGQSKFTMVDLDQKKEIFSSEGVNVYLGDEYAIMRDERRDREYRVYNYKQGSGMIWSDGSNFPDFQVFDEKYVLTRFGVVYDIVTGKELYDHDGYKQFTEYKDGLFYFTKKEEKGPKYVVTFDPVSKERTQTRKAVEALDVNIDQAMTTEEFNSKYTFPEEFPAASQFDSVLAQTGKYLIAKVYKVWPDGAKQAYVVFFDRTTGKVASDLGTDGVMLGERVEIYKDIQLLKARFSNFFFIFDLKDGKVLRNKIMDISRNESNAVVTINKDYLITRNLESYKYDHYDYEITYLSDEKRGKVVHLRFAHDGILVRSELPEGSPYLFVFSIKLPGTSSFKSYVFNLENISDDFGLSESILQSDDLNKLSYEYKNNKLTIPKMDASRVWYKEIIDLKTGKSSNVYVETSKEADQAQVGGIDLNPALLDMQIRRDANGVPLKMDMQPVKDMKIEGFIPVIINITPVTNVGLLLGFNTDEAPAQQISRVHDTSVLMSAACIKEEVLEKIA